MDYLNTIYIEWIYPGVELHNLMNISNPVTFRVETFQLSLSMKSPLNVNSSGLKRFDSERKIFQDIYSKCFIITDNTSQSRSSPLGPNKTATQCFINHLFVYMSVKQNLFVSVFVHKCLMMLNDVEYTTFKMFVTQISNYLFVISFQVKFHKTFRYRLARALCIFNCSFNYNV